MLETISEMNDSFAVNVAYHCDDPNIGMALTQDLGKYKMYVADTGIFVTLAFWDKKFTENVIYSKLLGDKLSVNLGYVFENMVAQMLRANGHRLFYHTFLREDGKNYHEVDFLIADGAKLKPVEVKSSGYKSHVSIDRFCEKYSSRIERSYIVYTKDLRKEGNTLYLPIYMTMFL